MAVLLSLYIFGLRSCSITLLTLDPFLQASDNVSPKVLLGEAVPLLLLDEATPVEELSTKSAKAHQNLLGCKSVLFPSPKLRKRPQPFIEKIMKS